MMKLLTITVPSYNSEAYLDRCMATLLPGGDEVEILIVDDGSNRPYSRKLRTNMREK